MLLRALDSLSSKNPTNEPPSTNKHTHTTTTTTTSLLQLMIFVSHCILFFLFFFLIRPFLLRIVANPCNIQNYVQKNKIFKTDDVVKYT